MSKLPKDTVIDHDCMCDCPWCSVDMGAATLTLENLAFAWTGGITATPTRTPDGEPEALALQVDCPNCARPSMIGLQVRGSGERLEIVVRLLAIRTVADLKLMRGTR